MKIIEVRFHDLLLSSDYFSQIDIDNFYSLEFLYEITNLAVQMRFLSGYKYQSGQTASGVEIMNDFHRVFK